MAKKLNEMLVSRTARAKVLAIHVIAQVANELAPESARLLHETWNSDYDQLG